MENTTILKSMADSKWIRWTVLLLVSITIATNYYVYDALSSIKSLMQSQLGFSSTDYGLIVAFYSFPNTFLAMSVVGGVILDKWGIRKTGFLFVLFCVLGALLTAYGASPYFRNHGFGYNFFAGITTKISPELLIMILGRLLFGLGAETSIVVINKIMVKWFKGKELALAFASNIALARMGTAAALIISPALTDQVTNWNNSLWLATILMTIGFGTYLIYLLYDRKLDRQVQQSGSLLAPDEEFHFQDILDLIKNKSYLYICTLCVIFYSAVFPFIAYTPDLLKNKYSVDYQNIGIVKFIIDILQNTYHFSQSTTQLIIGGIIASLIPIGTIGFTPLFGWIVDKYGKRATLMIYGSILLLVVHLLIAFTHVSPFIPFLCAGIAFSLVPSAMWPSVALIVEENKLGTAYGLMASIQNLGLFAFPILAGNILDSTNIGITAEMVDTGKAVLNYQMTILMFAGLGVLSIIFAVLLKRETNKVASFNLDA
ncbi:MAG: MFS transporter [Candidatus Kapabacteria bacterium]|nr:MFS transporter [Candidatus Kapabacteria bacterium]